MLRNLCSISLAILSILITLSTGAQAGSLQPEDKKRPNQISEDKNWDLSLGAGVMYGNKYEGSDNYGVKPLPVLSAEYKNGLFFVGILDGIGSYFLQNENYKVGASIGFSLGRDEDDDKDNLRGMGDIDMATTANLMGEYDIGSVKFSGKLTKGNEDYGMTAEADIGTMFPVTDKFTVMGSVGIKWADEDNMNTYFGVSPKQSASSGYARYKANAGFKSAGITVSAFYDVTENWNVMFMVSGDQLLGDAADSPIVKQKFQSMTMLSVSYNF